jgi:hypothetical protein
LCFLLFFFLWIDFTFVSKKLVFFYNYSWTSY